MAFSPAELRLLADVLEMASDQFGNHGCNDYDGAAIAGEGWAEFVKAAHEDNGDPEEFDPARPEMPDWWVMAFLSTRAKQELEAS